MNYSTVRKRELFGVEISLQRHQRIIKDKITILIIQTRTCSFLVHQTKINIRANNNCWWDQRILRLPVCRGPTYFWGSRSPDFENWKLLNYRTGLRQSSPLLIQDQLTWLVRCKQTGLTSALAAWKQLSQSRKQLATTISGDARPGIRGGTAFQFPTEQIYQKCAVVISGLEKT